MVDLANSYSPGTYSGLSTDEQWMTNKEIGDQSQHQIRTFDENLELSESDQNLLVNSLSFASLHL